MLKILLRTAKTTGQAIQVAGLTLAIFALPLFMALGVGVHQLTTELEDGSLLGSGDDDPVVYMADLDARLTRSEAESGNGSKSSSESGSGKDAVNKAGGRKSARTGARTVNRHRVDTSEERLIASGQRMAEARAGFSRNKKARGTSRCAKPTEGIEHLSGETYEIERSVIQHYSGDIGSARRLAAVAWHENDRGKKDGFRVGRIRCGTPLAQVGIRNGDVIHSINGKEVRSIPSAFSAVRKVTRNDLIKVELTRGGKRIYKTVRVL